MSLHVRDESKTGETIELNRRRKHAIVHLMIRMSTQYIIYTDTRFMRRDMRFPTSIRPEKRQSVPSNVRCSRSSRFQACNSDVIAIVKKKNKDTVGVKGFFSLSRPKNSSIYPGGSTLGRGVASFRFPVDPNESWHFDFADVEKYS